MIVRYIGEDTTDLREGGLYLAHALKDTDQTIEVKDLSGEWYAYPRYLFELVEICPEWQTQKRIITDVAELNGCSVLFLDKEPPKTEWRMIVIDGKKYPPVPIYDMKGAVAVKGCGFEAGQIVSFE